MRIAERAEVTSPQCGSPLLLFAYTPRGEADATFWERSLRPQYDTLLSLHEGKVGLFVLQRVEENTHSPA